MIFGTSGRPSPTYVVIIIYITRFVGVGVLDEPFFYFAENNKKSVTKLNPFGIIKGIGKTYRKGKRYAS